MTLKTTSDYTVQRRMLRWCLLAGGCLVGLFGVGCAGTPGAHSDVGIGVIDAQRILNETQAGQRAKESLSGFVKNRQELIQLEEKELKRMEESLIKQASVLSANARKEREEKFRLRMIQYQKKAAELNREVQEKQREVLEEFRGEVEKVVTRLAKELGLVVVIEKGQGSQTIYSDTSVDISDKVIQEFNRTSR